MRAFKLLAICAAMAGATAANAPANAQEIDWQKVDSAIGRGAAVTGDVHRYGFPRSDLQVSVDGVTVRPALALGGWAAFQPAGGEAMVMGDLVLLGTPATLYMHIEGHGDPVKLAAALRSALGLSRTPLGPPAAAPTSPSP